MVLILRNESPKEEFDLNIGTVISYTFGLVASFFTIYQVFSIFNGIELVVAILSLSLLVIAVILAYTIMKYRKLLDAYEVVADNRNTLRTMYEENSKELEFYKNDRFRLITHIQNLLLNMQVEKGKNDKEIVRKTMSAENDSEVEEIVKHIQDS
ncbi:nucleoside diphosphate kinase [Alkalibacillus almallahensis]|nr:nucleoside diphosphate kinase [Alkalibacillus almallahensis]